MKRLILMATLFVPGVALAQGGPLSKDTPTTKAAPQEASISIEGKILPARKMDWMTSREERVEVDVPSTDALVRYIFTNHGGTLRHVYLLDEKFTREAVVLDHAPKERTEAGQIDLVSTWGVMWLPYRFQFKDVKFGKKGDDGSAPIWEEKGYGPVTRVMRKSTSGQFLNNNNKLTDSQTALWPVDGKVKANDWVEIELAGGKVSKRFVIQKIEGDSLILEGEVPDLKGKVSYKVLRIGDFSDVFGADPTFTRVSKKPGLPLVYVWPNPETDTSPIFIEKRYEASDKPYQMRLSVRIRNFSEYLVDFSTNVTITGWQNPSEVSGGMFTRRTEAMAGSCYTGETLERDEFESLMPDPESGQAKFTSAPFDEKNATWIGVDSVYFLSALVSTSSHIPECSFYGGHINGGALGGSQLEFRKLRLRVGSKACTPEWLKLKGRMSCKEAQKELNYDPLKSTRRLTDAKQVALNRHDDDKEKLAKIHAAFDALDAAQTKKGSAIFTFSIYTGPKNPEILEKAGNKLKHAMDYGILGVIAEFLHSLLRSFFDLTGSWAFAIILLTILVKIVLLPLTNKSFSAMQKMQKLKPELDELKAKNKNNRDAMNKAMFALYKRHKVNPLGGCLPMVLQMPIWIALYQTIGGAVELFHTPLGLWIDDLSAQDPYYIFPVVMGLLMMVQNQISGSTASMEGMQAKIMKWGMPIMFTAFMLFLPAGLVLYILVNTTLTIFQNIFIRRRLS